MISTIVDWSEERTQEAIKVLKPYADAAGEDFTREDAIESMNNLVAFSEILLEWDRKQRKIELPRLLSVIKQIQSFKSV